MEGSIWSSPMSRQLSSGIREIRSRMGSNLKGILVESAASAACRVKGTPPLAVVFHLISFYRIR